VLENIVTHREIGIEPHVEQALSPEEFRDCIALARRIFLPEVVANFIGRLVHATHPGESKAAEGVKYGASPRAALALAAAAKARAFLGKRLNASFEDVQAVARPVLQHRLILDYRARVGGRTTTTVVAALLEEIKPGSAEIPATLLAAKI
jgi:MoxR-like ATPase